MLLQIRDFIQREAVASTQQMAREFQVDEQALLPMLDIWVRKGAIEQCQENTGCKSACTRCKTNGPVFYRTLLNRPVLPWRHCL